MKYTFEQEPLTCVSLETELGLKRGDVKELITHPSGAVEVETAVDLTATQHDAVKATLAKRNLPRGKKPIAL